MVNGVDGYGIAMLTPVNMNTNANQALIEADESYTICVKYCRIHVRAITSGSVQVGGDTTADSPVVAKLSDVGESVINIERGVGIEITADKGLYLIATGNPDFTVEVGYHKMRNDLG